MSPECLAHLFFKRLSSGPETCFRYTEAMTDKIEQGDKIMHRVVIGVALAATGLFGQEETPDHRLRTSTAVLHEIVTAPDRGIPKELLSKAQCVVIVPELKKAAFLF